MRSDPYDWAAEASWTIGGAPEASMDKTVTIPDDDNESSLSTSQIESKLQANYYLESKTDLAITAGGVLNINGVLVVEGNLMLTEGTINVNEGSLIVTGISFKYQMKQPMQVLI